MTLESLLQIHGRLDWRQQDKKLQVTKLCSDSRHVVPGSVYVAIKGSTQDGHEYIEQAISSGAHALVVEDIQKVPKDYQGAVLEVLDGRLSLQSLSQKFFGSPGDQLLAIAVTGTNGKTSTTYILEYLLNQLGETCGVIGTIDHHILKKKWSTNLTTPDPITLQERLKDFLALNGKSFVIEASSHALSQSRIDQGFDVVMFSNLSRDHLDYHKSMDDYFLAKAKLFSSRMLKDNHDCMAVINIDDPYGQKLIPMVEGRRIYTYGRSSQADLRFAIVDSRLDGTDINLTVGGQNNFLVKSPLIGEHNAYNLISALTVIYGMGFDLLKAADSFARFPGIPGRMQKLQSTKGVFGFVDYAHTPDALEKAIDALKPLVSENNQLITVFGCGGDRDQGKRPLMGEIATGLSDLAIVTSDNPRTEDPAKIIKQICQGFKNKKEVKFMAILDREEAIKQACQRAQPGDAILVAGKGHEDYQIIGHDKRHFDDYQILKKYLHD